MIPLRPGWDDPSIPPAGRLRSPRSRLSSTDKHPQRALRVSSPQHRVCPTCPVCNQNDKSQCDILQLFRSFGSVRSVVVQFEVARASSPCPVTAEMAVPLETETHRSFRPIAYRNLRARYRCPRRQRNCHTVFPLPYPGWAKPLPHRLAETPWPARPHCSFNPFENYAKILRVSKLMGR